MTDIACFNNLTNNEINKWKITAITYNLNGQRSNQNIIDKWLSGEDEISSSEIVCIALQVNF